MKEILQKLEELCGLCENRLKKLEQEKSELGGIRATLTTKEEELKNKEKMIKKSEKALNDKELIIGSLSEANVILEKAKDDSNKIKAEYDLLSKNIKDFEKKKEDFENEIARQKAKLVKESQGLEEKKKNYKQEVIEELAKEKLRRA